MAGSATLTPRRRAGDVTNGSPIVAGAPVATSTAITPHDRLLRLLIALIGTHSCLLGVVLLALPQLTLRTFGFPADVPVFFPSQSGIFLLILGICYLLAVAEPALTKVILVSKALAVGFLFSHAAFFAAPPIVWLMLAGDASMLAALSTVLLLRRLRLGVRT